MEVIKNGCDEEGTLEQISYIYGGFLKDNEFIDKSLKEEIVTALVNEKLFQIEDKVEYPGTIHMLDGIYSDIIYEHYKGQQLSEMVPLLLLKLRGKKHILFHISPNFYKCENESIKYTLLIDEQLEELILQW